MRKLVSIEGIPPIDKNPRRFALLPTFVHEAHPTHKKTWLIWWEWYELGNGYKWLSSNT